MKKTLVLALAAIMVLGVAGAAFAGSAVFTDADAGATAGTAKGTVNVNAQVKPKITLTITTTEGAAATDLLLDWATTPLDPGTDPAAKSVTLAVNSNKKYTLGRDVTGMAALGTAGYTFTYSDLAPVAPATAWDQTTGTTARTHTDSVDPGAIGYDIVPGVTTAGTIVYSAVQQ